MTKRHVVNTSRKILHYIFLSVFRKKKNILNNIGDEDEGGTPVPIPNTEVKPLDAEDT